MATQIFLELDDRRRASLGRIGRHSQYLVTEEDDGTLVFTPAAVVPELELRVLRSPAAMQALEEGIAAGERGEFGPRGWTSTSG